MNRQKNPTETTGRKRKGPSSKTRKSDHKEESDRTIPGKRTPSVEKQHDRVVNEDEQLKTVNNSEDNAQTPPRVENPTSDRDTSDRPKENENERLEAANDNNEVNPRPPKVN